MHGIQDGAEEHEDEELKADTHKIICHCESSRSNLILNRKLTQIAEDCILGISTLRASSFIAMTDYSDAFKNTRVRKKDASSVSAIKARKNPMMT